MSLKHGPTTNPNINMSGNDGERQDGAGSSGDGNNLVALLTAALRGAAFAPQLRGDDDGKGIPAPASFNGDNLDLA